MNSKLLVVLGAGASAGLNLLSNKPLDSNSHRPPVASEIFSQSSRFRSILRKYPRAEVLASDIDRKMKMNTPGLSLEEILRTYADKLKEPAKSLKADQFLEIPLYINHLFGEISNQFTKQPDEYNILVNECLENIDHVVFLTLNYDCLLEIPLSAITGIDFSNSKDYLSQDKWKLIKLHGSTNWYKILPGQSPIEQTDKEYFSLLHKLPTPIALPEEIYFLKPTEFGKFYLGNSAVYPVITTPVAGKYEFNCPKEHKTALENFLLDCPNVLIIGSSLKDDDLLDCLGQCKNLKRLKIVGRSSEGVAQAKMNLKQKLPHLLSGLSSYFHNDTGFADFVGSGKLDEFLDEIKLNKLMS